MERDPAFIEYLERQHREPGQQVQAAVHASEASNQDNYKSSNRSQAELIRRNGLENTPPVSWASVTEKLDALDTPEEDQETNEDMMDIDSICEGRALTDSILHLIIEEVSNVFSNRNYRQL